MEIKKNFKEMPFLLKVLFVISVVSFIMSVISLIGMKEIDFSYFGSGFPKNYPLVWNLYNVLMGGFGLYVFMKRSYSLLVKYTIIGAVLLFISVLNSIYYLSSLSEQIQIISTLIIYVVAYLIAGSIMIYSLRQKKYFNKD